ncbi:sirohydrochlorin chelatase [Oceanobacillus sp. FSL K6-2867]|uniref:sirohydrochlorin chelatase n=1 Tax=Oceanobacillus sp. FSL K6-2867 TaxID=2954748 RepID=UPI0030DC86EA
MIDAVVYIGHGSRRDEGNEQFITFIESVKTDVPLPNQEIAFLELANPTIAETIEMLIEKGAERFLIVPVLLFSAVHHKQDIPEALQAIRSKHEHISFLITDPFGVHSNMIKLVVKRIEAEINEKDAAVLLVGRGSSDTNPIMGLQQIGRAVEQRLDKPVYEAFLTAAVPSFDTVIAKLQNQYEKVYVMPYLLFTGLLLKRIEQTIGPSQDYFHLCKNLEFDVLMKQTLIERIEEAFHGAVVSNDDETAWQESCHSWWRSNSSA